MAILAASLLVTEWALRAFVPVSVSTIGHTQAPNAERYGWGYGPRELVRLRDPDTGRVYVDATNNHGWRDRDREIDKPSGTYRILALGDSNTFGVIVPAEDTWTRVLERELRESGVDAEVINMAYPRWGTDNELEALRHEGVRYRPDVIVLQFTINDLTDNLNESVGDAVHKPFRYRIGPKGTLERETLPFVPSPYSRQLLKRIIASSEILKRAYIAWEKIRFFSRPDYLVTETQLEQLRLVLSLGDSEPIIARLAAAAGQPLDEQEVAEIVEATGHARDLDVVLRVLENHPFKAFWMTQQYVPKASSPFAREWMLFFGLLDEIRKTAESIGADLVILTDQEQGLYEWERYWYRIAPGDEAKQGFLAPNQLLRQFALGHGMGYVEPVHTHERARNDAHPNRAGTHAMALNVLTHLRASHGNDLAARRMR